METQFLLSEQVYARAKVVFSPLKVRSLKWAYSLLPRGSPFGDPGPHGDLFQFLGPQKVPIFFQGPHFLYFRLKNALKVRASTIILVICILKGEFSETHLFNENGANLCTK